MYLEALLKPFDRLTLPFGSMLSYDIGTKFWRSPLTGSRWNPFIGWDWHRPNFFSQRRSSLEPFTQCAIKFNENAWRLRPRWETNRRKVLGKSILIWFFNQANVRLQLTWPMLMSLRKLKKMIKMKGWSTKMRMQIKFHRHDQLSITWVLTVSLKETIIACYSLYYTFFSTIWIITSFFEGISLISHLNYGLSSDFHWNLFKSRTRFAVFEFSVDWHFQIVKLFRLNWLLNKAICLTN